MKIACVSAAVLAFAAATCSAQVGTAFFEWQVSTDNGTTWTSGETTVPQTQQSVRIRAWSGWSADAGYGFSAARFDAIVSGAGVSDTIESFAIPRSLANASNLAFLQVQRFGNVIKIDDRRDTLAPGLGTRGVNVGQGREDTFDPPFLRDNPVAVFEYVLRLDASLGTRTISESFLAPNRPGGNTTDRVLQIRVGLLFVDNLPLVTRRGASITVIPAPGVLGLTSFALVYNSRRRR
jgi:hypothetical protein